MNENLNEQQTVARAYREMTPVQKELFKMMINMAFSAMQAILKCNEAETSKNKEEFIG